MTHLIDNPSHFPSKEAHFRISGPCGWLEVKTSIPSPEHPQKDTVVVICHPNPLQQGTMDNKVVHTAMRAFVQIGYPVVRFNYRGVGQSEGTYGDKEGEVDDLMAVLGWINRVLPKQRYILVGFSFGSYISGRAVRRWPATIHLVSIAPPVFYEGFSELNPNCPWTILACTADEVVPFTQIQEWYQSQPEGKKLIVFEGASHFFHGQLVPLRETLMAEFKEVSSGSFYAPPF